MIDTPMVRLLPAVDLVYNIRRLSGVVTGPYYQSNVFENKFFASRNHDFIE